MQIDSAGYTAALGAANRLAQGVSLASAWGFETILTCLLVFTVFAATDAQRAVKTAHLPVSARSVHQGREISWLSESGQPRGLR